MELTISVVRTGGVAGMRRSWDLHIECGEQAEAWRALIDACPWDAAASAGTPDRFVYRITAGDRTATVPEHELRGPWRELTDRVRAAAEGASPLPGAP